jgi:Cu(I)/Ag(I) efflux system protein CusF
MNTLMKVMLTTLLLSTALPALAADAMAGMDMKGMSMAPATPHVAHAVGIITALDASSGKVKLNHQAITALGWPAMEMVFKVADAKQLAGLNVGQKVAFELTPQGNSQVVTAIAPAP